MAALHTAPDSPAAHLERAEDGSDCDPEEEEEEEEEKGEEVEMLEDEEELVVEEEEEEDEEVVEDGGQVGQVDVELQEDVEEVMAGEQSPASETQECLSHGGDAKSPALQEKGKKEPATGEGGQVGAWVARPGELFGPMG